MTSLNKKLAVLTLVSFFLCAFSFLPFVRQKSAPKAFQSALLNPSHREDVTEILLSCKDDNGTSSAQRGENTKETHGNAAISLKKHAASIGQDSSFWTASDRLTTVRADEKLVKNLLDNAIKLRKMYTISDSKKQWASLDSASFVVQYRNNNTMYTKIDFFNTNSLTNRIVFTVEAQRNVYETEDTLSQFLTTDIKYWAKPELIQTISTPISLIFQENGKNPVKITDFSPEFERISHDVFVLRHGAILLPTDSKSFGESLSQASAATLTVLDEKGDSERISFYLQKYGYRCEYSFSPDASDNLHFAFEISDWTYDRLKTIFQ